MKKRLIVSLLAVILVLGLAVSAHAEGEDVQVTAQVLDAVGGNVITSAYSGDTVYIEFTVSENNVSGGFAGIGIGFDLNDTYLETVSDYKVFWGEVCNGDNGSLMATNSYFGWTAAGAACTDSDFVLCTVPVKIKNTVQNNTEVAIGFKAREVACSVNGTGETYALAVVNPSLNVLHEHSVTDWTDNNDATCTGNGTHTGVCTGCGLSVTEEIENSALGHDFDNGTTTATTDATCTAAGSKTVQCSRCSETTTIAVEPLYHKNATYVEQVAPTAENDYNGHYEYWYCSSCDLYLRVDPTSLEDDDGNSRLPTDEEIFGYGTEGYNATLYSIMLGDADNNGKITAYDATVILRNIYEYIDPSTNEISTIPSEKNADVDGNGVVTAYDATQILRCIYEYSNADGQYGISSEGTLIIP